MDVEARRRKLQFRAAHRGLRELDLYVGSFAQERVKSMTNEELTEFEAILDMPDNTVLDWIYSHVAPDQEALGKVLRDLLNYQFPTQS